jgi:fluoroquinolone transport system permease protein
MKRLFCAIKTDIVIQFRNKLYTIGIFVGLILAAAISQLAGPATLSEAIPTVMLLVIGGSTLFYVGGIIVFERDEGTLSALIASPLRVSEYLWSKIITLTLLATLESVVMTAGAMAIMSRIYDFALPNVPILLSGIIGIAILYTLAGIILIVRYRSVTDFLIPMAGLAVILQLPFLYFLGVVEHPLFLVIPTSAPTVLMQGAFVDLQTWKWIYGIFYTILLISGFGYWAYQAFQKHIIFKAGAGV